MDNCLLVLTNVPNQNVAQQIARSVVAEKLVACVNILPSICSVYRWQGQIEEANEVILLMKTVSQHFDLLRDEIKRLHPYETPEIIGLPITEALPAYFQWIVQETKRDVDV